MSEIAQKSAFRKWRGGFTVLEVMVASVILMTGLMAVSGAFSYARQTVFRAEKRLESLHIARRVMEELRARSYDSLAVTAKTDFDNGRGSYSVKQLSGWSGKEIEVVVRWKDLDGMTRDVRLITYHSKVLHF